MLVDAAAHASGASKRLISPPYLCFGGKFADMMEEKHTTIEKQEKQTKYRGQNQKKQRAEDISQKLTSLFLGDPCRTACSAGLTTRSSVAGGL